MEPVIGYRTTLRDALSRPVTPHEQSVFLKRWWHQRILAARPLRRLALLS